MTDAEPLQQVRDRLGTSAAAVVESISDPDLAARVARAILVVDAALATVDAFDLALHETGDLASADGAAADLSAWNAVAPMVRNVLTAVQRAVEEVGVLFPVTRPELPAAELELDDMFEALVAGPLPEPIRDHRERELDDIVNRSADRKEEIAHALAELSSLLRADFVSFGQRLRNPAVVADRWFLLGELQELKTKCTQGMEAILASILSAFTREPVEALLPRYTNATQRAIKLRTMIVDLCEDVVALHEALLVALPEQAGVIVDSLARRVDELARDPAHAYLRPSDKREFMLFRLRLVASGAPPIPRDSQRPARGRARAPALSSQGLVELRREVDGFARFLELLRAINRREVLHRHDRRVLDIARMMLDSEAEPAEVLLELETVYGRSEGLDRLIREARFGAPVELEVLREAVDLASGELSV